MSRGRNRQSRARRAGDRALVALAVLLAGAAAGTPLSAQERILSYDSEVEIQADGSLLVTENITFRAEGHQIRRGIHRDFPTRYRDRYGNLVRVDLEVLGVERNGVPEAWFTERRDNGVRINTGGDAFLRVPGEYTFTLRYRTTRQLGFFDDIDELYWNAIGHGWIFPIESGSAVVRLAEPVPVERMTAEAFTGRRGARGRAYTATLPAPGVARYELTESLGPREGMTIVLTFPKGIVAEPTRVDRARWFLADNRGVLVALLGLIGLLAFCLERWRAVGRGPPARVIIPRYHPPKGRAPGELRYLRRMECDARCFASDLLNLAVTGHVVIHRDEGQRKDEWRVDRSDSPPGRPESPAHQALLDRLLGYGPSIELNDENAARISRARSEHGDALDKALHGKYFRRNSGTGVVAFLLTVVTAGLALVVSDGHGWLAIFGITAIMVAISAVFSDNIKAPTPPGRRLLDEVEGLRLYLSVAERQELAAVAGPAGSAHPSRIHGLVAVSDPGTGFGDAGPSARRGPPPLDAGRYEALLPYAVALDVEDAWTKKFTAAVGVVAATEATGSIVWYRGSQPMDDPGSFSRSLGSSFSSTIASASSPPGSSSGSSDFGSSSFGSSGGGFSGGGGGGGGGGGR
jgi:uncharacterized membrane protein YgcG